MGRNSLQGETMLHTRKAQTEDAVAAMAARNARRVEIAKRAMGDRYAHHPDNHVQRLGPHTVRVRIITASGESTGLLRL